MKEKLSKIDSKQKKSKKIDESIIERCINSIKRIKNVILYNASN